MIGLTGVLDQDLPRGRFPITPHPAPWQPRAAPRQVPAPGVSASRRTRVGSGSLQHVTGLAQWQIPVHTLSARYVPRQLSPRSPAWCSSSVAALLQPHHSEGGVRTLLSRSVHVPWQGQGLHSPDSAFKCKLQEYF